MRVGAIWSEGAKTELIVRADLRLVVILVPIFAVIPTHLAKAAVVVRTRFLLFGGAALFRLRMPKLAGVFVVAKPVVVKEATNWDTRLVILVQILAIFTLLARSLHPEHADVLLALGFVD